jgi:hypothetical protein
MKSSAVTPDMYSCAAFRHAQVHAGGRALFEGGGGGETRSSCACNVPASDSASIAVEKCLLIAPSSVLLGRTCRSILLA